MRHPRLAAASAALLLMASATRAAPGAPAPEQAASQPSAKRPAQTVTDQTDCETWWRLFDESADCFGAYRTTRGGLKPEAFDHCNVIPSPEPKCGPRVF